MKFFLSYYNWVSKKKSAGTKFKNVNHTLMIEV
jgi:hypothetical protein